MRHSEPSAGRNGVRDLHDEIDRRARALAGRHDGRLQCRLGCASCCIDGLTVFEIEAERIRRRHERLLKTGTPHPLGACAFLDARGACRVYAERPYVCRTQGLPLRWLARDRRGRTVEMRDVCPLNDLPLEALPEDACWTLGPYEEKLARLERARGGDPPRRVRLRDLFRARS